MDVFQSPVTWTRMVLMAIIWLACGMCTYHSSKNRRFDEEFTFNIEGSFVEAIQAQRETLHKFERGSIVSTTDRWLIDPHVDEIMKDAQRRHDIFSDELVIKAFYEAEKAHRGQV